ncbi:MAG: hypothetical protein WC705_00105 [Candidatus Paceibacterota bacterium]|jgi:hypothetical protein
MDTNHNINYEEIAQAVQDRIDRNTEVKGLSHKEIISDIIKERMSSLPPAQQPQTTQVTHEPKRDDSKDSSFMPDYASASDEKTKSRVYYLIEKTLEKGLTEGLKEAREQDPFILDLYHDSLVDKLSDEMKKRGLI